MPDMNYGAWPAFWFMSAGVNNDAAEYDLYEGGFVASGVNQAITTSTHLGTTDSRKIDVGVDLSKDYHVYAMEYVPGQRLTTFFDGKQISNWTSNIPTGQYCILITLAMGQNVTWRTVSDAVNHSGPFKMTVKSMQVYAR
jgi:beta-glucanase (GH16 family)